MRLIALLLALCWAGPSLAQTADQVWTEDAFGLFADASAQDERHGWSGLQARVTRGVRSESAVAADPAYRVLIFTGPKSLVAGEENGQVVAIALDQLGNLAGSGDMARITIGAETHPAAIAHGIADHHFPAPVRAGQYASGVTVGSAQSNRATFRVNSDLASVTPRLRERDPILTPETVDQLTTDTLTDRYGNTVEDGVTLALRLTHDDGFSLLTATTAKGTAEASILARGIEGFATATATLGAQRSAAVQLGVRTIAGAPSPQVRLTPMDEIAAIQAVFGPLATDMGFAVNDGTEVSLEFRHKGRVHRISGWTLDGFLTVNLPVPTGALPIDATLRSTLGQQQVRLSTVDLVEPGASEVAE